MYEHKTLVNKEGFIINPCVRLKDNIVQDIEIKEDEKLVKSCDNFNYIKPKWNDIEWVEGANEQEIKEWQEKNIPKPKEPTEVEQLQKQLLETQNMLVELQYKLTNKALQSK